MRIAIIQFPGSNCERETMLAIERAGMQPEEFLWNESKEKLANYDGFVIVGGFSYEDRSRAGIIAALDPVLDVLKEQSELGKPILGICNGAQILVESGLVPGVEKNKVVMALTDNKRLIDNTVLGTGYYNTWVNIRLSDHYQYNAFTRCLSPRSILRIPVAHGEGRFVIPPALLAEIQANGLNVFQYCDPQGNILPDFPVNPNGSIDNIAAISNKAGNVMAIMPHPERTAACDAIFQSMRAYISSGNKQKVLPLNYYPRQTEIKKFQPQGYSFLIDLVITDNHAMTVENALRQKGVPVSVKRFTHWEIECDSPEIFEQIKATGVLFNSRKENVAKHSVSKGQSFLIKPKEDMYGLQKLQMLKHHFGVDGVHAVRHSVIWQLTGKEQSINDVINSQILFNPNSHDCYSY